MIQQGNRGEHEGTGERLCLEYRDRESAVGNFPELRNNSGTRAARQNLNEIMTKDSKYSFRSGHHAYLKQFKKCNKLK